MTAPRSYPVRCTDAPDDRPRGGPSRRVFHLVAHVNVDQSLGDPVSFLETNVMGTYRP